MSADQRALTGSLVDPAAIVQSLDEHHLVITGGTRPGRGRFASRLADWMAVLPETEVVAIDGLALDGARLDGTSSIAVALGAVATAGAFRFGGTQDDLAVLITALREAREARRQYLIWSDADALLERRPALFERVTNAIFAVAAEREFVSAEALTIQRAVLLGGPALARYAADGAGPLTRWLGLDNRDRFRDVYGYVERPNVMWRRLEARPPA